MDAGHFTVKIDLGNDAMATHMDVAKALRDIVAKLESHDAAVHDGGRIRDANGNTVGVWAVTTAAARR